MKKYYIYKLTDLITGEFYIGSRGYDGDPQNDSYMGSPHVWKPVKENLSKTILYIDVDDKTEILNIERKFILDNIEHELNRNYSIPHNKLRRDNLITVRCMITDKTLSISKDDPLFGVQFVGVTKGKALVKDPDGFNFLIDVNDPRYVSGELKHSNYGLRSGNEHPNINKISINNGEKQRFIDKNTDIPDGWFEGVLSNPPSHEKSIWVHNKLINKNKRIPKVELDSFLEKGFELGRINLKKYEKRK